MAIDKDPFSNKSERPFGDRLRAIKHNLGRRGTALAVTLGLVGAGVGAEQAIKYATKDNGGPKVGRLDINANPSLDINANPNLPKQLQLGDQAGKISVSTDHLEAPKRDIPKNGADGETSDGTVSSDQL